MEVDGIISTLVKLPLFWAARDERRLHHQTGIFLGNIYFTNKHKRIGYCCFHGKD